jgi:hypothetical protein
MDPEMKFLDIAGSRDEIRGHQFDSRLASFAPCVFTVPSTGGFYRTKKISETEFSNLLMKGLLW